MQTQILKYKKIQKVITESGPSLPGLPPSPQRLLDVVRGWPQLAFLRAAAGGARRGWQHATSLLVASARCELSASLLAHQARVPGRSLADEVGSAVLVAQGAARFEALSDLLAGGMLYLAGQWRLTAAQTGQVISKLRSLAGLQRFWLWSCSSPRGRGGPLGSDTLSAHCSALCCCSFERVALVPCAAHLCRRQFRQFLQPGLRLHHLLWHGALYGAFTDWALAGRACVGVRRRRSFRLGVL